MILQHQKSVIPPIANPINQRNFGLESRAQKAPRGSNKVSQSQLPLTSIEQSYDDEENIIPLNQKKTSVGTNRNNLASKQNLNQGPSFQSSVAKSRLGQNSSQISNLKNVGHNQGEPSFNLDSEGVSQLQYPPQEGQFYSPNVQQSNTKKQITPTQMDDFSQRAPIGNTTQQNYYMPYDPSRYAGSTYSQQNQVRPKQISKINFNYELQGFKELISKNPSTAAGTYFHESFGGGGHQHMTSQGGMGQMHNESFDLDIMMPPDVASIDSDLNKLSALTPQPMLKNEQQVQDSTQALLQMIL